MMQAIPRVLTAILLREPPCTLQLLRPSEIPAAVPAARADAVRRGCSQPHAALLQRRERSCQIPTCCAASGHVDLQSQVWRGALGSAAAAAVQEEQGGATMQCTMQDLSPATADALSDALLEAGATSAAISDHGAAGPAEQELFADGRRRLWDRCTLTAHFAPGADVAAALAAAAAMAGLDAPPAADVQPVSSVDWEQTILDSYQPLCIVPESDDGCGSLWVVPSWASQPDVRDAVSVMMEPGLAFGTGEHPTTRLCLRWLWRRRDELQGCSVMDYGAGSGVLALTAMRLGAAAGTATDVDACAVRMCRRNAELNGVADRLLALPCGRDLQAPEPLAAAGVLPGRRTFDVVAANILAGPLADLAPRLAAYVKPGGRLALAGILAGRQAERVVEAYEQLLDDVTVEETDSGWALVTGTGR